MVLLSFLTFFWVVGITEPKQELIDDDFHLSYQSVSWDDFVQSLSYDAETATGQSWQDYLLGLEQLHTNPLDINTATPEEMAQIPFLTAGQIQDIQAYVHLDGPMKTLGELALIPSIDAETRRILPLFLYVSDRRGKTGKTTGFQSLFAGHRHTIDTRTDVPLYHRRGFQTGYYRGDALYNRIRYNMTSSHVQAGAHAEKDAGEKWFDSYGAYLMLRDLGTVRNLIVGDFRAGWGEGLVMGARSLSGKSGMMNPTSQGVRPMTGTGETGYMRGAAITLGSNVPYQADGKRITWQTTLFASYNLLDATLNDDGTVRTFVTTGYHRSENEIFKKNNTSATTLGAHAQLGYRHLTFGVTGYWQHLSRKLSPGNERYRQWYPRGNNFGNIGLSVVYSHYRWTASSELAYGLSSESKGGIAAFGKVIYLATRNWKLGLAGRYYSHKYYSFYSSALSENSETRNETGVMFRVEATPWRNWTLTSYIDFFSDYWPRYHMTHSSNGQDFMIEARWQPTSMTNSARHELSLRYNLKRKESSDIMIPHHRVRMQWTAEPSDRCKLQTTGNLHVATNTGETRKVGFSVSENIKTVMLRNRSMVLTVMGAYFNTPDYLTRVYVYEPALWNCISGTTYFGQGMRAVAGLRYTHPRGHWMVEGRYSLTKMFDRDYIASGEDMIPGNIKNDISIQIRYTI